MDHQRFARLLPALYDGWGGPSARPRDPRFAQVLSHVRGMSAPGVLQLLNQAVACLGVGERYAEIGCFQGATLVGAMLGHEGCRAVAADDFSRFDPEGTNLEALVRNLEAFGLRGRVDLHRLDAEAFLVGQRDREGRMGVYFYDAGHDYRSQLMGLLLVAPLLAPQALLVIDDANWPEARQACWDFMAARPEARLLLDLPTPGNGHPSFWNGLMAMAWNENGNNGYSSAELGRGRQDGLLASLRALEGIRLRREGGRLEAAPSRQPSGAATA